MHFCTCTSFCLLALVWAQGHIASARGVPEHCLQKGRIDTESHALLQLTEKRTRLSPVPDADADLVEDADNPLEKMYALEDALAMAAKPMTFAQDHPEFDCKEGVSKLTLGWSQEKKDFCCQTAKVGCANGTETMSNGTKNNNTNKVSNSLGNDTGNATDNPTGSTNVTNNSSNVTNHSTCITREDPRISSTFYTTSPAGTPCVFGVDPRDEGSHCIMEGGKYGSFGWCYTSKSRQSWGSCSESCPLFGPSKVLGAKINKLDSALGDTVRRELKKILGDTRQENTTVPTHGKKDAPAASGKTSGDATGTDSGKANSKAGNRNSDDAKDEDTGKAKGKKATSGTGSPNTKNQETSEKEKKEGSTKVQDDNDASARNRKRMNRDDGEALEEETEQETEDEADDEQDDVEA